MNKIEIATARKFEVTARSIAKSEGMVADAIKALGELLKPYVTAKEGKATLAREVRPFRAKWLAAYAKAKGIDPDSDGARQAWSRYTRAAMAGASSLEGTQSRKTAKAKGSENKPRGGAVPGEVAQANADAPMPNADSVDGVAHKVPVTKGQRLALVVNEARAGSAELGAALAAIDPKVKGRAECLAAFNRLADTLRALESAATAVLAG